MEDFLPPQQGAQGEPGAPAGAPAGQPEMLPPPQGDIAPQQPQGAGLGAVEQDPLTMDEEGASEQQQEQYDDLFIQVMTVVHNMEDTGKGATADHIVKALSSPNRDPAQSIGGLAGTIMVQVLDKGKRQKESKEYEPEVIQEVGLDLINELVEVADASGAIKNLPQEEEEGHDEFIQTAALEAAKTFGQHMVSTGQVDQQANMQDLQQGMRREQEGGELDDWGMEEFDPKMRRDLANQIGDITNG